MGSEEIETGKDKGLGFWQRRSYGTSGVFERDGKLTPWRRFSDFRRRKTVAPSWRARNQPGGGGAFRSINPLFSKFQWKVYLYFIL